MPLKVFATLICVAADIPARRKVCGFVGHSASRACSKCFTFFTGGSNYDNYTAEEWNNWTLTFSMYALHRILPDNQLRVWERFVLARQPVITKQEVLKADALL